jgi:GNAT superfamily N-acetyltransferase
VTTRLATITRRPAEPRDADFLRELFAESRPDFDLLPLDLRSSIVDLQVRAQRSHYAAAYPAANEDILVADGVDVGRLMINRGDESVRIIDITVRSSCRGQGIASRILREVVETAEQAGVPVGLSVWSSNTTARRVYERLGFTVVGDAGGYLEMQRAVTTEGD